MTVDSGQYRFYEKVVKVKAEVAAILNSFCSAVSMFFSIRVCSAIVEVNLGGCARGVSAERFETPLAGGAAACRGVGGTRPPRLALGGNGKGGSNSLLPQAILFRQ